MYRKKITYTDYNGVERTEDFYFNFTKAELAEMELTTDGGFAEYITAITEANDQSQIVKIFKELVLKAYGEKSPDGRRFMKSEEISNAFAQTEAYSELFMELATNADEATKFFEAITPSVAAPDKAVVSVVG